MSSSTTTWRRWSAARSSSAFFLRLRRTSAYAPAPPATTTAPTPTSAPVFTEPPEPEPPPHEAGAWPFICGSALSTKALSWVAASVLVPGARTALFRFWTACFDMTLRSAPEVNASPSRIAYKPVTPVSVRRFWRIVLLGKAALLGSTATKSGLSASLIFFASASAWAALSWFAAPGST